MPRAGRLVSRWTAAKAGFVLLLAGSILAAESGKTPTVAEAPLAYAPSALEEDGFTVRENRWGALAPPLARVTMAD
ncbi:MAG: hypothetical protein HOH66_10820 [Rhodospirillaceae bacterium]|jgi:hypothetical protein|nr:hypothetical protein [Rhodospirillaceae bacterium]